MNEVYVVEYEVDTRYGMERIKHIFNNEQESNAFYDGLCPAIHWFACKHKMVVDNDTLESFIELDHIILHF